MLEPIVIMPRGLTPMKQPTMGFTKAAMLSAAVCALALAACSKGDPQDGKARANAPLRDAKPSADANTLKPDSGEGLKDRLSRQEAASKLFESRKPEPPPPPKARVPSERAPAPVAVAPSRAPEPVKLPEPAPAASTPAPKAAPAATETAAARPVPPAVRVVSRIDPEFPEEAVKSGIPRTRVKSRVTLDADGNVMRVDLAEGTPRALDRAVVSALSQWRFEDGAYGRTVDVVVEFKR